jgi:uncharacterized protein (TIGR00369 family)
VTEPNHSNTPAPAPAADIPEGFRTIRLGGGFMQTNGPLYSRLVDGQVQLGFRVEHRHCNPLGICHGGMLATFADMLLASIAIYDAQSRGEKRFVPTINLQMDYLAAAPMGCWLQGSGEVLRTTRNMVFVQAVARVDGTPVLRTSGIFKVGPAASGGADPDPLNLRA